jgi:DNA-binding MarR family transcriptional regulator
MTPAGVDLHNQGGNARLEFEAKLMKGLSATEREQFHRLLKLALHNLDDAAL